MVVTLGYLVTKHYLGTKGNHMDRAFK